MPVDQALYQTVAQELATSAPSGWTKAWVTTRVEPNDMTENLFDHLDAKGEERWFEAPATSVAAIGRALRDIRAQMARDGQEPWSRCVFTLHPDGKFKLDVSYDD